MYKQEGDNRAMEKWEGRKRQVMMGEEKKNGDGN
jgi:hypothetical protein